MPQSREELLRGALNTLHEAISDADQIENELRRLNAKLLSVDLRLDSVDEAIVRVGIIRSNARVRMHAHKTELNVILEQERKLSETLWRQDARA